MTTQSHLHVGDESRGGLLRAARRLALFTLVWNVTEGAVAITAAWMAGSRALAGFGLDSAVESVSAAVLLWRLDAERRDPERVEHVERIAVRAIGVSFLVLAGYVAVDATRSLALQAKPDVSRVGIALTLVSLVVMPILATRKHRVALALGSKAAEVDSAQTRACAYLSARLEKAEAGAAKWKAEAKRLKKLLTVQAPSADGPVSPAVAEAKAPTTSGVPDDSWTVTRLRESARDAGVPGYSRMTKTALLDSLTRPK